MSAPVRQNKNEDLKAFLMTLQFTNDSDFHHLFSCSCSIKILSDESNQLDCVLMDGNAKRIVEKSPQVHSLK